MARFDGKRSGTVVFDDLAFKLTPSERIIFGIIHRFAGYHLGECRLKSSKLAELAGVHRSTVYNVVNRLRGLGMIEVIVRRKQSGAKYVVFVVVDDQLEIVEKQQPNQLESLESDNLTQVVEGAEKTFDPRMKGNEDINALFNYWSSTFSTPIYNRVRANRRAAWNLLQKNGFEPVCRMIDFAREARYNDYAPRVSDFVTLQSKWSDIELWAEKRAQAHLMKDYEAMSIEDRVEFRNNNPKLAKIIDEKRKAL